jgi:hypothetical protein
MVKMLLAEKDNLHASFYDCLYTFVGTDNFQVARMLDLGANVVTG